MTLSLLLVVAADQAAEGGIGGPFVIEPGLIIWTWIVFGALFLLLRKYAWPPIVRLTEEREHKIAAQLEEAERLNRQAQTALEEHQKLLSGAKDEALVLINEAKTLAHQEREHLLAKAQEEHQQILDRARREIDAERDRALSEMRREAVDLSLAAATRLIEQRLDAGADRKIVEDYIAAIGDSAR